MRPTTTSGNSDLDPSFFGYPVTFTATVTAASGTPTGTVTFVDTTTATMLGTVSLLAGQASFTTSSLAFGSHSILATYNPDPGFATSSGTVIQLVNLRPTPTS